MLIDISIWAWKGEVLGLIGGYALSYFFYLKSRKDAHKAAKDATAELLKANKKISGLEESLLKNKMAVQKATTLIETLKTGSDQHDQQTTHLTNQLSTLFQILNSTEESSHIKDEDIDAKFVHLLNTDKLDEAEQFLELSRRKLSEPLRYFYLNGCLLFRRGKYQEALTSLNMIPGDFFEIWKIKGEIYHGYLRQMPEAIYCLSNALRMQPDNPVLLSYLIGSLIKNDQLELAFEKAQSGVQAFPDHPDVNFVWGEVNVVTGQFEQGLKAVEKAVGLGYPEENTKHCLGVAYFQIGEFKNALEHFIKIPHDSSGYETTAINIIGCYAALDRYLDVERTVEQFKKLYPKDPRIADAHILVYSKSNPKKAIQLGEMYDLFSDPAENLMAINNLACAYFEVGDFDKALEYVELVLSYDPDHELALGNVAAVLIKKEPTSAEKPLYYLNRLYDELNCRSLKVYWGLGICYKVMKDYDKALEIYREALSLFPDDLTLKESRNALLNSRLVAEGKIQSIDEDTK